MRSDRPDPPVISTYAVGGPVAVPRRGGRFALPAFALLGTASAVALVTLSFDDDAPVASPQSRTPVPGGPAADDLQAAAAPGFTDRFAAPPAGGDAAPTRAAVEPPAVASAREAERLPFLSVLQTPAAERPVAAPAPARIPFVARTAEAPRVAAAPAAQASADPACGADCPADETPAAESGLVAVDPAGVADQPAGLAVAEAGPVLADSAAVERLAVDQAETDEALLADARPTVLVEPPGGPIGELAVAGRAPLPAAEAPLPAAEAPSEALAEPSAPERPTESAGLASEPEPASAPAAAPDDRVAPTPGPALARTTIPEHLARIGERYASVPVAEGPPPDAPLAAEPAPPSPQSEGAVALAAEGLDGSSVIVQDDELVAIRLGELVSLLEDRFDQPLYVWLKSSAAASKFVTAETLASAGITTRYDPQRQQVVLSVAGD